MANAWGSSWGSAWGRTWGSAPSGNAVTVNTVASLGNLFKKTVIQPQGINPWRYGPTVEDLREALTHGATRKARDARLAKEKARRHDAILRAMFADWMDSDD